MTDTSMLIELIQAHYSNNEKSFREVIDEIIEAYDNVGLKHSSAIIKKCIEENDEMSKIAQSGLGNVLAQMEAQTINHLLNPDAYAEPTWELAECIIEEEMQKNEQH